MTNPYIKTKEEQQKMREAGKILANIIKKVKEKTTPGTATLELEETFIQQCTKYQVIPACKGYQQYNLPPFPTGLCVSVNNQSVHCYPKKDTILTDTDIITVDFVISHNNFHADASYALAMPNASIQRKALVKASEAGLYDAISKVRPNTHIGAVSERMQKTALAYGFNVLQEYAGHGIGFDMHEWPEVACYGNKNSGPKLKEGMIIAIESLMCTGNYKVQNTSAWETRMKDGGDFAQWEHTVLVTADGFEILTS